MLDQRESIIEENENDVITPKKKRKEIDGEVG
jgi:hypothetical protein